MEDIADKIITIEYDEIKNITFKKNEKTGLIITLDGNNYEFLVRKVNSYENILVSSPSFLNSKQKEQYRSKPVFSRHSWFDESQYNMICYNDPTRYDFKNLNGGWGIGTTETWHLENIAKIIVELSYNITNYEESNIKEFSNIFFYGSSMGGFMAMVLSVLLKNSTSIADEPQFNVTDDGYWKNLKRNIFKGLTEEQIKEYSHRLSIVDLINKEKTIPNSYIVCDCTDEVYWNSQFKVFLNHQDSLPYNYNNFSNMHFRFDGKYIGHRALPRNEVLGLIDDIMFLQKRKNMLNPVVNTMTDEFGRRIQRLYDEYTGKKISYNKFSSKKNMYFNKWLKCRVDIKNVGDTENSIEVLGDIDETVNVDYPDWFKNDEGQGCIISSENNSLKLQLKCVNDGNLDIKLRGSAFKDENNRRIPVYICYKKLKVNDDVIFSKDYLVWHDKPYVFSKKCSNNEIINLEIEFVTLNDKYPYLKQLLKNMDGNQGNLKNSYNSFRDYIKYIKMVNNPLI